jgi:cell division septation protein DedD
LPKNEDGEFELVLGNKQLLSMFFVVVVLLGVFFIMGYIVGRNSAPLVADISRRPDTKPPVADSPAPKQPSETQPAATPAASPEPARTAKSEQAKAEAAKPEPASKGSVVAQSNQTTAGGTYLQLSATDKPDADKMVDELRKNGFPALASEVPEKLGTFRVLVGPIAGGDVNKMRVDLQSKSFPGDKAIPRKF